MKRRYVVIYVILLLILIKLLFSFIVNEVVVAKYKDSEYDIGLAKKLSMLNLVEPCIAHYNLGNIYYQQSEYKKAIEEYDKALKLFPTEKQECSIRINKALCIIKDIDIENKTVEKNIEILKNARKVLCENGCAHENDKNGHSKTAEELKAEIDKMINKLENSKEEKEEKEDKEDKEEEQKQDKNTEEKLKEIQKKARQEREESLQEINEISFQEYSYSGKKW